MAIRVVDIVLEKDGDITISPTTLHVNRNDQIKWQMFGADAFMVISRDGGVTAPGGDPEMRSTDGPLDPANGRRVHDLLMSQPGIGGNGPIAIGNASGVPGTHNYQLAIVEKGNRLHMDSGCPEVIIR